MLNYGASLERAKRFSHKSEVYRPNEITIHEQYQKLSQKQYWPFIYFAVLKYESMNEEFMKLSKLKREYESNFMGERLIRSVILLEDLEVIKIITEDPGEFKKTSYDEILKVI